MHKKQHKADQEQKNAKGVKKEGGKEALEPLSTAEREVLAASNDPILQEMLDQERIVSDEVDTRLLGHLFAYLKSHKGLAITSALLSVFEAALMTVPAYLIGFAVDVVRPIESTRPVRWVHDVLMDMARAVPVGGWLGYSGTDAIVVGFAGMMFCMILVRLVVSMSATYLMQMLGQRVVHDLRMDVYRHVISMDMGFFHTHPVGRLVNRTTFDTKMLSEFFSDAFAQGLRDTLFICALVFVMLSLDVPLTFVILGSFPFLVVSGWLYRRYARPAMRTTHAVSSRMNSWIAEHISGMRENQLYGAQGRRRAEFRALTHAHQKSVRRWIAAWGWLRPLMMVICAIATAVILAYGYERVISGMITVGILITFLQYTTRMWVPVRNLTEKFTIIQNALTATERIFDVLSTKTQMKDSMDAHSDAFVMHGAIDFFGVHFAYPSKPEDEVLKGIDFSVPAGQTIALVGDTGAGKSTIAHLISRFYDATAGRVCIDGRDVCAYTLERLRSGIALVPQDVVIFAGTVRDNITLGHEVSDDIVWKCVRAVRADRFIDRFDDGLDHVMDESGRTLSAGERQLLSFARALVLNPPVLILDEATSNVDTETEALIQEALEHLTKDRTSVVIAHRLSTIREADQILVLRHGKVVERGTHEELLHQNGAYARLHALHMGGH